MLAQLAVAAGVCRAAQQCGRGESVAGEQSGAPVQRQERAHISVRAAGLCSGAGAVQQPAADTAEAARPVRAAGQKQQQQRAAVAWLA